MRCCCQSACQLSDSTDEAVDASWAAASPAGGRRAHLLAGDSVDGEAHKARVAIARLEGRRGLPGRLCILPCGPRIVRRIHHGIVLTWRPRAERHGLKSIQDSLHSPSTSRSASQHGMPLPLQWAMVQGTYTILCLLKDNQEMSALKRPMQLACSILHIGGKGCISSTKLKNGSPR